MIAFVIVLVCSSFLHETYGMLNGMQAPSGQPKGICCVLQKLITDSTETCREACIVICEFLVLTRNSVNIDTTGITATRVEIGSKQVYDDAAFYTDVVSFIAVNDNCNFFVLKLKVGIPYYRQFVTDLPGASVDSGYFYAWDTNNFATNRNLQYGQLNQKSANIMTCPNLQSPSQHTFGTLTATPCSSDIGFTFDIEIKPTALHMKASQCINPNSLMNSCGDSTFCDLSVVRPQVYKIINDQFCRK